VASPCIDLLGKLFVLLTLLIYANLWNLFRLPKDRETKDPVEDSRKGEDTPKVTKPLTLRVLKEGTKAANVNCLEAKSSPPSPRVEGLAAAASLQTEDDLVQSSTEEIPRPLPKTHSPLLRTQISSRSGAIWASM
jgi:hypothetical protein